MQLNSNVPLLIMLEIHQNKDNNALPNMRYRYPGSNDIAEKFQVFVR